MRLDVRRCSVFLLIWDVDRCVAHKSTPPKKHLAIWFFTGKVAQNEGRGRCVGALLRVGTKYTPPVGFGLLGSFLFFYRDEFPLIASDRNFKDACRKKVEQDLR